MPKRLLPKRTLPKRSSTKPNPSLPKPSLPKPALPKASLPTRWGQSSTKAVSFRPFIPPTMMGKEFAAPDPLARLLEFMNDERLPPMTRVKIAAKIAPYFHPKLKPIPASAAPDYFGPSAPHDQADSFENSVQSAESLERYRLTFARLRAELALDPNLASASTAGRRRS
ncbi:hypothetical protein GGD67_005988 [Bradyrhizobium sp. IAR9]|uniref:hypothetical protein n=1 Tax=Bradyrhizobium sp. IAR9 TaxID=2663841 RepID=UPI0015CC5C6D|nr:hypothetical protein [Bradyrhizobium sp. IAR9]NYG48503.1 hypothetical protein [Bradyrhizobium sp. IAR9]